MAVRLGEGRSGVPCTADSSTIEAPFWYSMFGVLVRSDVRLPMPLLDGPSDGQDAAWSILLAPRVVVPNPVGQIEAEIRCRCDVHSGAVVRRVHRDGNEASFWFLDSGTIVASADSRCVEVYPSVPADDPSLGLVLCGPVAVFMLNRLGYPTLHASAVVADGMGLAFLGPKGRGKSTMGATFLQRGASLLTDDVLPLRIERGKVFGGPGIPLMKVWPEAAERTLAITDELPRVVPHLEKRLLALGERYPMVKVPSRLHGFYVLDRYDSAEVGITETTIQRLSGAAALTTLLAQLSDGAYLDAPAQGRLLPNLMHLVARVPVKAVRYPNGFEHQETVWRRILTDASAT